MKRASSAHRRSLLHKNKLEDFKKWVLDGRGYYQMPPTAHAYEVFRVRKYNRSGDEPDIFFYKKDRTDHITLCEDGEKLVKAWLRDRKEGQSAQILPLKATPKKHSR